MLVLLTTVLLLFGAPALMLLLGRAIERVTDGRRRPDARLEAARPVGGEAWFYRRPVPVFGKPAARDGLDQDAAWFCRPMRPAFRR